MVYDIVLEPNKILHEESSDMNLSDIKSREIQKLIKDMVETMYVKNGVGLAGVQIGKPLKICVIAKNFNTLNPREDLCLINPSWKKISVFQKSDEEGCLSIPGLYGQRKRYTKIKVSAYDKNGNKLEFVAQDFFARIVQHEVDHLNGHLYIEKATKIHKVEQNS